MKNQIYNKNKAVLSFLFNTYKEFYVYLDKFKSIFYQQIGVIFLLAISNTALIWFIGQPFGFLTSGDYSGLVSVLFILFGITIVNQGLHYISLYRVNCIALDYIGELRNQLLSRFVHSSSVVTDQVAKGELLSRLSHDVDAMQRFVVETPLFFASHIFTIVLYSTVLVYINWELAIITALLTPAFFIHQKIFSKKKREAAEKFFDRNGKLLAKEDEILGNLRVINALNCQKTLISQHKDTFNKTLVWAKKERHLNALFDSTLAIVVYFCALFIVYQGVDKVDSGELSVAGLVSFLLYMGYMSVPLRGITQLFFQAQADAMCGGRLSPYMSEPSVGNTSVDDELAVEAGHISFESVSCSFKDAKILNKLSFNIESGKTVAIVGGSGVGKSTIANLLMGFIKPNSGSIIIDQQNINDFHVDSIREKLGIVWQSPMIFNDSIKNNMLLANPSATDEMIDTALHDSDAALFIAELPEGINTLIGANGVILSAGQKQRLHIAQAFLRDSEILIMDEATSALDSESEQRLVNNIKRMREGKTTILIAHRYSSLRFADYIIYLNTDGTVNTGTHEVLLEKHSEYAQALSWQSGF